MIKNPEDEKLITKGAAKEAMERLTRTLPKCPDENYAQLRYYPVLEAIDNLPACLPAVRQAVSIKSPEEIGRAIKHFKVYERNLPNFTFSPKELNDLLRWISGQEQDTWSNKELLG